MRAEPGGESAPLILAEDLAARFAASRAFEAVLYSDLRT